MSNVHLPSLYIKGFRTFEQLAIPTLQRINLLVGKNNTGKTSLLEAVYLYANRGSPRAMFAVVGIRGERIPIGSTGEGMNRLLGIMLALLNARDGFLLIDEIEIGLHYTVQVEMWRLIFEMAERLHVQVFATTHSWDCIAALQEAMTVSETTDGQLISLQRRRSNPNLIELVTYDAEELKIATRLDLEVR